jgi:hypothetical protein
MYDPDPPRPTLSLADLSDLADKAEARTKGYLSRALKDPAIKAAVHEPSRGRSTAELLAEAELQMEEAIKRWVDTYNAWTIERLQSLPIPVSGKPVGDGAVRYERPAVYRASGQVEQF